jgi:hypothetical protein
VIAKVLVSPESIGEATEATDARAEVDLHNAAIAILRNGILTISGESELRELVTEVVKAKRRSTRAGEAWDELVTKHFKFASEAPLRKSIGDADDISGFVRAISDRADVVVVSAAQAEHLGMRAETPLIHDERAGVDLSRLYAVSTSHALRTESFGGGPGTPRDKVWRECFRDLVEVSSEIVIADPYLGRCTNAGEALPWLIEQIAKSPGRKARTVRIAFRSDPDAHAGKPGKAITARAVMRKLEPDLRSIRQAGHRGINRLEIISPSKAESRKAFRDDFVTQERWALFDNARVAFVKHSFQLLNASTTPKTIEVHLVTSGPSLRSRQHERLRLDDLMGRGDKRKRVGEAHMATLQFE